ncbi:MAG TPA: glycerol kinase, partial [Alphaproteobacteria bacterium]|nr:glycerol kinase [Alphaproteobacteria bacterium]
MPQDNLILSIDQGTTSTRAILFSGDGRILTQASRPLTQHYPQDGWVEHDAMDIWQDVLAAGREVLVGQDLGRVAALGITNQRETCLIWDRKTGAPLHRAIVWQDRRTAEACAKLKAGGQERMITERTGLLLDPYFSGTKLTWLLDHVPDARLRAGRGEIAFGTIDSWLIHRLTGGTVHATDATNASRTLLFDIQRQCWDPEILKLLTIPHEILPRVTDCAGVIGETQAEHFGIPLKIAGAAGDQQAAAIGQACFTQGLMKATFGTGCFALTHTGAKAVASKNRLIATVANRIKQEASYALEGSIFMAGATIQWLRDGLGIIKSAPESAALAARADHKSRVVLVPAFVGLGAPYWDANARGAILGMTRDTGPAEIAKAALEAVSFQTRDLLEAMAGDMKALGLPAPTA